MNQSREIPIPEDLKEKCPNCRGTGYTDRSGFSDPASGVKIRCSTCRGKGWLWALDQQEMAERLAQAESQAAELQEMGITMSAQIGRYQVETAELREELAFYKKLCVNQESTIGNLKTTLERQQRSVTAMEWSKHCDVHEGMTMPTNGIVVVNRILASRSREQEPAQ